jgi:hypothetical protein
MTVQRTESSKTWAAIDKLLNQIERRAAQIRDDSISRDAHRAIVLLHNLATEIHHEDRGRP